MILVSSNHSGTLHYDLMIVDQEIGSENVRCIAATGASPDK